MGVDLSRKLLGKIFLELLIYQFNEGSYMKKFSAIIEIFNKLINNYGTDKKQYDQKIINEYYNNKDYFNNLVALDIKSIIFVNVNYTRYIFTILITIVKILIIFRMKIIIK